MKRSLSIYIIIIGILLFSNIFSQTPNAVQIGFSDTLHSKILNQDRLIQIYLPDEYDDSKEQYPVMFLCDGQWNFIHTLGILSFMGNNNVIPPIILIAIHHTIRDDDLVPQTTQSENYSGKADKFLAFIEKELISYIDENYRTQPFRILTGISYGGLFTNYTLITKPDLFNAYISVDPSLWWDNYRLINDSKNYFKQLESFEKILYFTQSEIPEMGSDKFAKMLYEKAPRGLKWKFNHMFLETHASITHRSIYDGLEFIFSDWSGEPVKIQPNGAIFRKNESLSVELSHPSAEKMYYTLNGEEPTINSNVYKDPIVIDKPCMLKARSSFGYHIWGRCDSAQFDLAVLQHADKTVKNLKKGLTWHLYEGDWDKLPDFTTLKVKSSGTADTISVAVSSLEDYFGLTFSGYINIKKGGIYTFYLSSDDGSRMKIGGKELINNDGLHGAVEVAKQVFLEKGKYQIDIEFFEKSGGEFLGLGYDGPDLEKQYIPADVLYHK